MNNTRTHIKKPITVKNNTHYFDPNRTRTKNTFINPRTYYHRQQKIEGYENRLYWEWKWCNENNGQTFYYTLTYNDKNVPKYNGENCFDYEDLRDLINGAFAKKLLRKYGTKFKYFISAELGDGKGKRGLHNNPHYHILFFLRDAENEKYTYEKIPTREFRKLVKNYWQGFDEEEEFKDYREAKKGIAKEGENEGLVTDYRAIQYCAKYVCKDVGLIKRENKIEQYYRLKYKKTVPTNPETYELFWDEIIKSKYNIHTKNEKGKLIYKWNDKELFNLIRPKNIIYKPTDEKYIFQYAGDIINAKKLENEYKEFCNEIIERKIKEKINEYRNRYCNKCRISHGVGDYALSHIKDLMNPKIQIDTKKGVKARPINLYYYRKLYCNVIKDKKGNNVYILNQLGMKYKNEELQRNINKMHDKALAQLSTLTEEKYNKIRQSSINTECFMYWNEVKNFIENGNKEETIKRYCEYKLVYEGRFFEISNNGYPKIDICNDYNNFIKPTIGMVEYRNNPISNFMENGCKGYMAYNTHTYFLQYMQFFNLFDTLADYYFIQEDEQKEKEAEEIKKTQRYFANTQFTNYINQKFKKL